jgi:threonine/homoserine/homoserine lactone efflux protein
MLRPLLARLRHRPQAASEALPDPAPQERQSFAGAFRRGAVLQAANPKNIAFFVAILPQFIAPDGPVALQLAVLGLTSVSLELPILLGYGFATSRAAALMTERVVEALEGAAGGILIALGAALALYRRAA